MFGRPHLCCIVDRIWRGADRRVRHHPRERVALRPRVDDDAVREAAEQHPQAVCAGTRSASRPRVTPKHGAPAQQLASQQNQPTGENSRVDLNHASFRRYRGTQYAALPHQTTAKHEDVVCAPPTNLFRHVGQGALSEQFLTDDKQHVAVQQAVDRTRETLPVSRHGGLHDDVCRAGGHRIRPPITRSKGSAAGPRTAARACGAARMQTEFAQI